MNVERLQKAFEKASGELLSRRTPDGHWIGRLSGSALSTATAVSALSIYRKTGPNDERLDSLIRRAVQWILDCQNTDGGWGDTDKNFSNISTTLLVKSALILSGIPTSGDVSSRMNAYIDARGGTDAVVRRYGKDKTFSVPILTNAALAGLVPWKDIFQLPFERAALPQSLFRLLKLQVVSYAIPALVAIGQVRFHHRKDFRPVGNFLRRLAVRPTLRLIERMQPESGGYLEAAPLTAFVVMSLTACGHAEHPVVRNGLRFLIDTVREDGSWPIDTNLAVWTTTLSINALQEPEMERSGIPGLIDWILSSQHRQRHPFTGAAPGGWGWTDLSGAVPDADDTPGVLLALAALWSTVNSPKKKKEILGAVESGLRWLQNLQNHDGGIPTFCRGWGLLPFDQSSTDLTAHTLRAFTVWTRLGLIDRALRLKRKRGTTVFRMISFLEKMQRSDGSWLPLWFGNQNMPDDVNPFYGTARVLRALIEVDPEHESIRRGVDWIVRNQNADGGWGSVEETAVIVETLAALPSKSDAYRRGLDWLVEAVESGRFTASSPIGLYFAKLWYYEELYPIIFTTAALRAALDKQKR